MYPVRSGNARGRLRNPKDPLCRSVLPNRHNNVRESLVSEHPHVAYPISKGDHPWHLLQLELIFWESLGESCRKHVLVQFLQHEEASPPNAQKLQKLPRIVASSANARSGTKAAKQALGRGHVSPAPGCPKTSPHRRHPVINIEPSGSKFKEDERWKRTLQERPNLSLSWLQASDTFRSPTEPPPFTYLRISCTCIQNPKPKTHNHEAMTQQ